MPCGTFRCTNDGAPAASHAANDMVATPLVDVPCTAADDGEPAAAGGRCGHAAQRHAAQGLLCQAAGGCRQGWQRTWCGILLFAWDEACWLCWLSTSENWKVAQAVRFRMPMLGLGDPLPACQTKLPNTVPTFPAAALHRLLGHLQPPCGAGDHAAQLLMSHWWVLPGVELEVLSGSMCCKRGCWHAWVPELPQRA